jgi:hypothetical protein
MAVLHKIAIMSLKIACSAHLFYDQLNCRMVRFSSELLRSELPTFLYPSLNYTSAATQQLFVPARFIVGAIWNTQFLN